MPQKQKSSQVVHLKDIEKLLDGQTAIILDAVDVKIGKLEKRVIGVEGKIEGLNTKIGIVEISLLAEIDEKIRKSEERINQKIERLTTTLDKFLKRMTDMEDEFTIMKLDLNRMKKVIREKLGVDLL